jgi:hypothetical protein
MLIYQILFVFSVIVAITIGIVGARLIARRPLKPFARNLLIGIIIFEVVLGVLHLLAAGDLFPPYWNWFFDLQYERNLGAIFSSLQLMLIAAIALVNLLLTPGLKWGQRLYWLFLAVTFVYLSCDEFYSCHETFGGRVPSDNWEIPYAIGGGIFVVISLLAYWIGFRRSLYLFGFLFGGLMILGLGAVAIEKFVRDGFVEGDSSLRWMFIFEEMFEMVGATVILTGFLAYASENLVERRWQAARSLFAGAGVLWTVWLFFSLLLLPALEARYSANPVQVDYDGGLLSLVGYRVFPEMVKPGDEVALTLYWRANRPLSTDYSVSVHALSHPDIDSVAQADDLHVGAIPSTVWFPNIVNSKTIYLQLPRNLPIPASYWLTLRVWSGPWPLGRPWSDTVGLPVSRSENRALLGEDSVVLASVPALPETPPAAPLTAATYRFTSDGFTLSGYTLPDTPVETHQLTTEFQWATDNKPNRRLTQFFHLIPRQSGEPFGFDQQPFAGSFPTDEWPTRVHVTDKWTLDLPDSLPAGTYDAYTGMYDLNTMERAAVIDSEGNAVPDNAIFLGSVTYAPSAEAEAALAQNAPGLCYAMSDSNSLDGSEADTLVAMNTTTGEAAEIGQTGSVKVEGVAFSPDHSILYAVDEREVGQFGVIDVETGQFTPVGSGLAVPENPARNPALYDSILKDIDSVSVDPETGELWGIHQDEENLLFQIDPQTGEVIRDTFATGFDYLKVDLTGLPEPGYVNVKDLAIDPQSGNFYVVVGNDAFDSFLTTIDLTTIDLDSGTVNLTSGKQLVSSADGQPIRDVEALSFTPNGTLYAISTNNSNTPDNYDVLWRIDPETGTSTPVGSFTRYVDYVDYEALACLDAVN